MVRARICIVSSHCLSSNPRVEKEADALADAGYDVQVLVCQGAEWMADWDAELARGKPWRLHTLEWFGTRRGRAPLWILSRGLQAGGRQLAGLFGAKRAWSAVACSDRVLPLLVAGWNLRGDLYIAHNLPALPVAAALARRAGARLAFDAEDDHVGELSEAEQSSTTARIVDAVQREYLPRCAYVTAASDGIADTLAGQYRIPRPTPLHNVFPLAATAQVDGRVLERRGARVSLYWYSQSLGLDRGLQDVIRAAGRLRGDFELHLRGNATGEVERELTALAAAAGIRARFHLHEQVKPTELLSRTAEHDVGLALEQPVSRNRLTTVTNKLFYYLLAGLAVAATDTPGQRRIMSTVPEAGFSYAPGDVGALASGLQRWLDDPAALQRAKAAALEGARTQWCWERECEKLIAHVRDTIGPP